MPTGYELGIPFFSWYRVLSKDESIPSAQGNLDKAMERAADSDKESYLAGILHFSQTRVGLRCIELPAMENIATDAGIIAPKDPEYTNYRFLVSQNAARRILERTSGVEGMQDFVSKVLENLNS